MTHIMKIICSLEISLFIFLLNQYFDRKTSSKFNFGAKNWKNLGSVQNCDVTSTLVQVLNDHTFLNDLYNNLNLNNTILKVNKFICFYKLQNFSSTSVCWYVWNDTFQYDFWNCPVNKITKLLQTPYKF